MRRWEGKVRREREAKRGEEEVRGDGGKTLEVYIAENY